MVLPHQKSDRFLEIRDVIFLNSINQLQIKIDYIGFVIIWDNIVTNASRVQAIGKKKIYSRNYKTTGKIPGNFLIHSQIIFKPCSSYKNVLFQPLKKGISELQNIFFLYQKDSSRLFRAFHRKLRTFWCLKEICSSCLLSIFVWGQ